MDFLSSILCFIVSLSMVALSHESSSSGKCRQCKPGYYASRLCSDTHDTICSPCANGTFTSNENSFQKCSKCSKCEVGEFLSVPCLSHSDTVCESCSAVSDVITDSFLRDCVQNDSPYRVKESSEERLNEKYSNDTRTFPIEHNVIYEGSGVSIIEEKEAGYDTSAELNETIEGSGEVHFERTTTVATNHSTAMPVPIIPDETEDNLEEIIKTVTETNISQTLYPTTKAPQTSTSETVSAQSPITRVDGVITIGTGIILNNDTGDLDKTDVIVTRAPMKTILIEPQQGITIPSETTTRKKGLRSDKDGSIIVNEEQAKYEDIPRDEPQFEASKTEDSTRETSGVSVGVFVAVCIVCAAVFFVIGLMVNKYWGTRRARSFNVEQAEKQNGKTFHDSRIEFKDPENNITTKTGIYDEIPVDKQNGKESLSKAPVYSKPIKRAANNPVTKTNPEAGVGASDKPKESSEWGGMIVGRDPSSGSLILTPSSDRPGNEARYSRPHSASIKYIDDEQTDDERETDKLLPTPNQEENLTTSENNATPNSSEEKHEVSATEVTPMITKDNDTINV